ncbi:MAG TPA: ABC transporter ATP-binding protein [Shinella sp.]|jgi:spermidine/putrescine ABC transporter ATP-binding subunit|uniref:ABC transporter ATP-binding protein n=1 Tax=Shinella sp. TaxID=1870904 RepID=UPI002E0FE9B8|nr:ABC transporter ATP-binding protein [Shinella sp.]
MTSSSNPILRIEGVGKNFGPVTAVDNVSLDIRENEFFALLGPSGCGKTTLLRMLAGFESLDAGRILLEGKDISPLPPEKRPLNLMFQSYALFPHMTVRQNLSYGLEMERLAKAEIRRRVDETMATTDLTPFADRKPEQLSGGQKQRVALARALVKRPKVLLLDEPLGALDKKLRERMQLELKRMQHEAGITFIIVTHDQEEALVMADRMAILKDGRLLQVGAPEDVYERPADRFVANFIGVMNFIDGKVGVDGLFEAEGLQVKAAGGEPGAATLAIRPENIVIGPPGDHPVSGVITDIAYHGLDRVLHVKTAATETPLQVRIPASGAGNWKIGDALSLKIDPAKCRLFNA